MVFGSLEASGWHPGVSQGCKTTQTCRFPSGTLQTFWNFPSLARSCPPFRVPSLIRPSKPRLSASGRPLGADDKRSKDQPTGNIDKPSILEFTTVFEPQKSSGPFKRKKPTDKIILRCQGTHNQSAERRPAKL